MKKTMASLICAALFLGLLAGCGSKTAGGQASGDGMPTVAGEPVWVRTGYGKYTDEDTVIWEKYTYEVHDGQVIIKTLVDGGNQYSDTGVFDENGKILDDGWNTYTYNEAGVVVTSVHKIKGTSTTTVKTYDASGKVTEEKDYSYYQSEGDKKLRGVRVYDANGNMVKEEIYESDGAYYRDEYTYNEKNQKTRKDSYQERGSWNVSSYTLYEYGENDLLTKGTYNQDDGVKTTTTYQYDEYGNVVLWCSETRGKGSHQKNTQEYAYLYDENGNVIEYRFAGEIPMKETYTYHSNGTMKSKTVSWLVYEENELWDENGHLVEKNRFNDGVMQYRYVYTYEQILVPQEAIGCIKSMQEYM